MTIEEQLAKALRERDEARAKIAGLPAWQKGCEQALADLADAEEAIVRLYTERDDARSTIEDLTDEIDRGRVAIRLWRVDMSDTRAVLERIAAAVGVEVVALAEDASIAIHRSALESCNRARAAAEAECIALRRELARLMDDH